MNSLRACGCARVLVVHAFVAGCVCVCVCVRACVCVKSACVCVCRCVRVMDCSLKGTSTEGN